MFVEFLNGHTRIVGHVDGERFDVTADSNGIAEVTDAVGEQLIAYGSATAVVESDSTDVDAMTVKELRAYASAHGISLGSARSKDEILAVIKGAGEPDEDGNDGDGKGGDE